MYDAKIAFEYPSHSNQIENEMYLIIARLSAKIQFDDGEKKNFLRKNFQIMFNL